MSRSITDPRYAYVVEYNDPQANIVRQYQLMYFTNDSSIEMYDLRNRRMFLKRCSYPSIQPSDLTVGSTVVVHARHLQVVAYSDEYTKKQYADVTMHSVVMVTDAAALSLGIIVDKLHAEHNMKVVRLKQCIMNGAPVTVLDVAGSGVDSLSKLTTEFEGVVVVTSADECDSIVARVFAPGKSDTAAFNNCTVLVIKPHAVNAGYCGSILQRVLDEGFEITAAQTFHLSHVDAKDMLEVYEGVVPEYKNLVEEMSSGTLWALELRAENAVVALRRVCGPHDPEVAKMLFPSTLRGKFGVDRIKNAVHCTDLPEDGVLESEFFFSIMAEKA